MCIYTFSDTCVKDPLRTGGCCAALSVFAYPKVVRSRSSGAYRKMPIASSPKSVRYSAAQPDTGVRHRCQNLGRETAIHEMGDWRARGAQVEGLSLARVNCSVDFFKSTLLRGS